MAENVKINAAPTWKKKEGINNAIRTFELPEN